jgi:hypothetical protein
LTTILAGDLPSRSIAMAPRPRPTTSISRVPMGGTVLLLPLRTARVAPCRRNHSSGLRKPPRKRGRRKYSSSRPNFLLSRKPSHRPLLTVMRTQ